ncbi:hypothetical protein AEMCBJ_32045 (plasmid) [Cupriavidus necator]
MKTGGSRRAPTPPSVPITITSPASAATLQTYRREVERLILWAVLQLGKPLSSLTHEDLLAYGRFLADPQPAARWVLTGSKKLARTHPDWRPFAGPLRATTLAMPRSLPRVATCTAKRMRGMRPPKSGTASVGPARPRMSQHRKTAQPALTQLATVLALARL